ncbi:hypothetical protein BJV74DRAFT_798068 [Russula compacta]|nr:hypothetical protein BJV74DRAFT_798068 [Russula compacta]
MDNNSFSGTSSMKIDGPSQESSIERLAAPHEKESEHRVKGQIACVTIGSLPDDVLLDVFNFYRFLVMRPRDEIWKWQTLANRTPVREMLDAFPNFPINIDYWHDMSSTHDTWHNILAALERRGQARWISLTGLTNPPLETFVTMMQDPFPLLTYLQFWSIDDVDSALVIPDTFLGRSTPRLQFLLLDRIAFPGLPKLLFSARDLVSLVLTQIPVTGYIPPEALADSLSALPNLMWFTIMFSSATSPPDRTGRRPPPLTRTILPSLTSFEFNGASEYLEGLVAPISAPLLDYASTLFVDQLFFDSPQLFRFIGRSDKLASPNQVTICFEHNITEIAFGPPAGTPELGRFRLQITCVESAWQDRLAAQVFSQSLSLLRKVERLEITGTYQPNWQDNVTQWLEIFRQYTAVRSLYVSDQMVALVSALGGLTGEETGEVLPALHSVFLEEFQPDGPVYDAVMSFVTARRLCGHPVDVHGCN